MNTQLCTLRDVTRLHVTRRYATANWGSGEISADHRLEKGDVVGQMKFFSKLFGVAA
jgi:hypothetical protein